MTPPATAIAAVFSGWLESILYGVSRHNPATITGVALLVCITVGEFSSESVRSLAKR